MENVRDSEIIKKQFELLDLDGSGSLSPQEIGHVLRNLGANLSDEDVKELFSAMDADGNGEVEFLEFVDFVFQSGEDSFFTDSDMSKLKEMQALSRSNSKREPQPEDPQEVGSRVLDLMEKNKELTREVESLKKKDKANLKVIDDLKGQLKSQNKKSGSKDSGKVSAGDEDADPEKLKEEISRLKAELHSKQFEIKRLESQQEKEVEGYVTFSQSLLETSATNSLGQYCHVDSAEMLGKGAYGYVMCCSDKEQKEKLVVKLQSSRWVSVAAQEWAHGAAVGSHENIVDYKQVLIHQDTSGEIRRRIQKAFDDGTFSGKVPKVIPDRYICMILEYMDSGTVDHIAKEKLLCLGGLAAIVRQVALALAYMHSQKHTHNDIKPENILLRRSSDGSHLVVKLADLGLGSYSVERERDMDLTAYTFWCLGLNEKFERVPKGDERTAAVERFSRDAFAEDKGRVKLREALSKIVKQLWQNDTDMAFIANDQAIQDFELRVLCDVKLAALEANAKIQNAERLDRRVNELSSAGHPASINVRRISDSGGFKSISEKS
eukprot:TRINITY_DN28762_c0_g1_i1.p1 TRINITY_DN28762_c0_g1~~TRINITY_DN28762_c0_g1_i1.p1  ORF type:complete len:549 (+),score=108.77 TRINITY_DN28762_c0_g1_i1:30-1676(+)